ncbi:sensor histidine kinase [Paenibacillus roseipurpureus]|uniref:histidine kinase n=1 Tax=Paenibacillus roseopurpureus TaxID=2918901 RepID=A0AA96RLC9_9BACL|nr:histidine kinase [Paenibacillus sp. MBLB1832]WNR43042.1 histidine kinase [Paenibacillus sp. MBLB1832]
MIPSIGILVLTNFYINKELLAKAYSRSEQSMEVSDLYIGSIVSDMVKTLNEIQYDQTTMANLRVLWDTAEPGESAKPTKRFYASQAVVEKLNQLTLFGGKTYATILLPTGDHLTNFSTYPSDLSFIYKEAWFQDLHKLPVNHTFFFGGQPNYVPSERKQDPHIITIIRSFQLYANTPNAYIMLSKSEKQFHEIFSKYQEDQTLILLDAKGQVISGLDTQQVGTTLSDSFDLSLPRGRTSWKGQDYIYVNHSLSYGNWRMISITPLQDITRKISSKLSEIFTVQFIFFILFSIALFYILRQFTKPIVQLARMAMQVEAGNLDVRLQLKQKDEIAKLSSALNAMLDRIKQMLEQVKQEQTRKRMAELELLQAQIHPHFLFNTLNSIRLRVMMKGEREIGMIIGSLSTLLRMTINRSNEFLPLHEEVKIVSQYIKLMNFRHHEHVTFTSDLASDTLLCSIPRLTLQPLIENAYIHGLQQRSGVIAIHSWKQGEMLYLQVEDDGIGMDADKLEKLQDMLTDSLNESRLTNEKTGLNGIGLKNVFERLRIIYGDMCSMTVLSAPGQGLKWTITLPYHEGRKEEGDDV